MLKKLLCTCLVALLLSGACASLAAAEQPIVKLTWATAPMTAPIDYAKVMEKLNAITREKLGVEVDIRYYDNDMLQNAMLSGETFDMYYSSTWYNNFNQAVSIGYFADITDKVKEWTPKLYAAIDPRAWEMAKSSDGRLYAIPISSDFANINYITYDAKFARDNGFKIPERIKSWNELTDFLVAHKKALPEGEYPVMLTGAAAGLESSFDFIDRDAMIGVKFGDTKVVTCFDDPEVMDRYRVLHKWMNMGLINPDAATQTSVDQKHHHIKFETAWPGYDFSPSYGYEAGVTCFCGPYLSTDSVQRNLTAFSVTLAEDEAKFKKALEYQEFVNTDQEYRDILACGIPGEHFNYVDIKNDDGTVAGRGIIRTELGKSNYIVWPFTQGLQFLRTPEVDEKQLDGTYAKPVLNLKERYDKMIETAPVSAISGFTFNSEKFDKELAQIQAVKSEYYTRIASGTIDPDTAVPEMLGKMNAVGLKDIIAEAQKQLDEYLAAKNAAKPAA